VGFDGGQIVDGDAGMGQRFMRGVLDGFHYGKIGRVFGYIALWSGKSHNFDGIFFGNPAFGKTFFRKYRYGRSAIRNFWAIQNIKIIQETFSVWFHL